MQVLTSEQPAVTRWDTRLASLVPASGSIHCLRRAGVILHGSSHMRRVDPEKTEQKIGVVNMVQHYLESCLSVFVFLTALLAVGKSCFFDLVWNGTHVCVCAWGIFLALGGSAHTLPRVSSDGIKYRPQ